MNNKVGYRENDSPIIKRLGIKVFVSNDGDIVKCSYLFDEDGNPREMILDESLK